MKKMNRIKIVTADRLDGMVTTFLGDGVDYHSGMGLPVTTESILSETAVSITVFEAGDRVIADVHRGSVQNEDGISSGGRWVTKHGIVEQVISSTGYLVDGLVRFDDGNYQVMSMIEGDRGYPGKNIRAE